MNLDLRPICWVANMDTKDLSYNIKTNLEIQSNLNTTRLVAHH